MQHRCIGHFAEVLARVSNCQDCGKSQLQSCTAFEKCTALMHLCAQTRTKYCFQRNLCCGNASYLDNSLLYANVLALIASLVSSER